tara:strand:- start:575 stop:1237 length:663 start_codon:yes stop_codon:yes gene_type:complete
MIVYDKIEQRSEEWHELKHGKIGGTLSKGLFVKSDTLLNEILSQRLEDFDMQDGYISSDMQRGIDLEPFAIAALEKEIFVEFKQVGFCQNTAIPLLGISPDGITEDETIMVEVKCPGSKKHTETICNDEIPQDNIHQVLHAFTVNPKLEQMYFVSYRWENKIKPLWYKMLTKDSEINLGTKAKPVIKTVAEWVEIARENAEDLNKQINDKLNELNERYAS